MRRRMDGRIPSISELRDKLRYRGGYGWTPDVPREPVHLCQGCCGAIVDGPEKICLACAAYGVPQ